MTEKIDFSSSFLSSSTCQVYSYGLEIFSIACPTSSSSEKPYSLARIKAE